MLNKAWSCWDIDAGSVWMERTLKKYCDNQGLDSVYNTWNFKKKKKVDLIAELSEG